MTLSVAGACFATAYHVVVQIVLVTARVYNYSVVWVLCPLAELPYHECYSTTHGIWKVRGYYLYFASQISLHYKIYIVFSIGS